MVITELLDNCQKSLERNDIHKLKNNLDTIDLELFNLFNTLNDKNITDEEKIKILKENIWGK